MGYQALLFCPDEKLARVVSQVFSELDFAVDPVSEPFAAVKKLMSQHYDAVVIDCDHEQNSSLLLKSAHTSTLNQGSLAIAMVEGQAGVARAYRIGANLVLTKPINLEQTKGTLRVARGLLRKNSETANAAAGHPASPAPVATAAPTPVARPIDPANRIHEVVATSRHGQSPEFEAPLPTMVASAKVEEKPAPVPAQKVVAPVASAPPPPTSREVPKNQRTITAAPAQPPAPVLEPTSTQGAASAPAPAKEIVATPKKVTEKKKQDELPEMETGAPGSKSSTGAASTFDGPSFAALDDDNAGGSGSKKLLIAAVAVFAVAVAGYFGWTQFGQGHSNPTPRAAASVPQAQATPTPDLAPTSAPAPVPAPSVSTTKKTSALIAVPAPKTSSAPSGQPVEVATSSTQNAMLQPEAKKAAATPLLVKSTTANKPAQPDAPSVQPPNPLAVASTSDSGLEGLLSSASSSVSRPSLARIRISQGVSQGMVIKRVQPRYPANALSAHIQGAVLIEATVNKEGIVANPKVLSGDSTLAAAALEAVRQWRYKPYYLDGEPVEIQTQITINFKVNQ